MTIGLCTIISLLEMKVITYAFQTYELALGQAIENQKGVLAKIQRLPETRGENGLRETSFMVQAFHELIVVQELALGDAVLPVSLLDDELSPARRRAALTQAMSEVESSDDPE